MSVGDPLGAVIVGASGRMGLSLVRLLPQFPGLRLHGAVVGPASPALGRDAGEWAGMPRTGIPLVADLAQALRGAALVLDFSTAVAAPSHTALCAEAGVPLLLGTTGLGPDMPAILERASESIPVLVAANTSLGAAVLEQLVGRAAAALGPGFDVRVQDTHHRHKRDAPSGTALRLGQAAGGGPAAPRAVEYASVRSGDVVGEHEVEFMGNGERLRLGHLVTDRAVFARGALRAGLWLARQKPGRHHMADIF